MRRFRAVVMVCSAVALTACGLAKPLPPFETYAHRQSDGRVDRYFNCRRPAAGAVQVDGWANNPYFPAPLKDLEFILYGVNAQGRNVSQAVAKAQSYLIQTNQPAAFTNEIRNAGGDVRYDLVQEYWGGPSGGGGASGSGGGGGARAQTMARNVCDDLVQQAKPESGLSD